MKKNSNNENFTRVSKTHAVTVNTNLNSIGLILNVHQNFLLGWCISYLYKGDFQGIFVIIT